MWVGDGGSGREKEDEEEVERVKERGRFEVRCLWKPENRCSILTDNIHDC